MTLNDRVVIITGAAGAIGLAAARIAAREGAKLLLVDIDAERLEAGRIEVESYGGEVATFVADCAKWDEVSAYAAAAVERFGRIDGFLNNAGIEGEVRPLQEYAEDEWHRVIGLDLTGVFLGLRHVLPIMMGQGHGAVVNTGSVGGERGLPDGPAYNAAKAGVAGLTRQAAVEAGRHGIRANAILPGFVDSPMMRKALRAMLPDVAVDDAMGRFGQVVPLGRCAQPEEIGEVAVFLLSDRASYLNGVCLAVDGGLLARLPMPQM